MSDEQRARDLLGDAIVEKALDSGWLPRDERPDPKYGTGSYGNGYDCRIEACLHRFRREHTHNWDIDILLARPPHTLAHTDGPDTAKAAAAASRMRRSSHRLALLRTYAKRGPLTTYGAYLCRAAHDHDMDLTETRRRATDLLNEGLIERTGDQRALPTGHKADVLAISHLGRLTLETIDKGA